MAFQTKDGKKKFGSSMVAKRYDEFHPEDEKSEQTGKPPIQSMVKKPSEPKADSRTDAKGEATMKSQFPVNSTSNTKGMHQDEGSPMHDEVANQESRTDENGESESPEETVSQHGSAHTVTVHHNHSEGKHKVISHHSDGHMSESNHPTPEAAHQHASKLGSSEGGNSEAKNEMDEGNQNLGDLSEIFNQ